MTEIKINFWNENGRTLQKPDLICLRQNHELYKTLILQLNGKIEYDVEGIRLADKTLAKTKLDLFIDKAINENVDLAITPEYSCPWTSIENIIEDNKLPGEGKIWVLGCQSIKPCEIITLIRRHQNLVWIYDEALVTDNLTENKFFDPVCLILKTRDENSEIKNVIIVQFKTCNSSEIWERDHLIQGRVFYLIENRIFSTKLLSLICSDTLQNIDFVSEQSIFLGLPLLIIHIQLNQKPFDLTYKQYRNTIYSYGNKEDYNKEIICLNWARGVTYNDQNGQELEFNKYGGSSFYCQTNKIELGDDRINANHCKGIYYTSWKNKKCHVLFLNYGELIFLIENTKPSQVASVAQLRNRTGPKAIKTFYWDNSWVEVPTVPDGFAQVCSDIDEGTGKLSCLTGNQNFTDVERIIQLSSGEIDESTEKDWSNILNLFSFQIKDNEFNNRNTFTHDPDSDSSNERKRRIEKYHVLKNNILTNPAQVPKAFTDATLKFDKSLTSKNIYLFNLHSEATGRKGTAIYLGLRMQPEAKAFKVKIESLFKEDQQGKQVMVWYNNPYLERIYDEERKPGISENVGKSPVSYKKNKI